VQLALLLLACAIEACCGYLVYLGDLRTQIPAFWAGFFAAFLCYLIAGYLILRRPCGSLLLILGSALIFRLTLLPSAPTLSDDIFRYIWDGRVQVAGINPYLYAPDDPALDHLRDALHQNINHREIPTIYPPLAQLFFRLTCSVSATPSALKLVLVLADWSLCFLLVRSLARRNQDPRRVLLYAWNPLPLIEVAGSGHIDALGVSLLFLGLHALQVRRATVAAGAFAGAFLAKLIPLILLPTFWLRPQNRTLANWLDPRGRGKFMIFPGLVLVAFLPFADAGDKLSTGLQRYMQHWHFNAAAYSVVHLVLELSSSNAHSYARWICVILLVPLALGAQIRLRDPYQAAFMTLGAYILLSPTMHPWYLLWILPFLPFFPSPAWMLFSGLVFLAYEVLIGYSSTGIWHENPWIMWAQYAPFYLLLGTTTFYRRVIRSRAPRTNQLTD